MITHINLCTQVTHTIHNNNVQSIFNVKLDLIVVLFRAKLLLSLIVYFLKIANDILWSFTLIGKFTFYRKKVNIILLVDIVYQSLFIYNLFIMYDLVKL